MRLNLDSLTVQSFATSSAKTTIDGGSSDTGQGGPDSLCYICYETGNTVPSCNGYECEPVDYRTDTWIDPACGWA